MKFRIIALLVSLILVFACFVSCGDVDQGKNGDDTVATDALTGDASENDVVVQGGKLSLSTEIIDNQLAVSVNLAGNKGLAAFSLEIHYDNTKLRPVDFIDSQLVDPGVILSNIHQGAEVIPELTFATAFYSNPSDFTGDGVLFTLLFDILEGASGETELSLVAEEGGFANQNVEMVVFELEGCKVTLG